MNSDCAITIGSSHPVCQDYARAGQLGDLHYVIIADGCSGSKDTDVGARLLVLSAERTLKNWATHKRLAMASAVESRNALYGVADMAILVAERDRKELLIGEGSLDATLGMIVSDGHRTWYGIFGDGIICIQYRDRTEFLMVEYPSGYPNYLNYRLNDERRKSCEDLLDGIVSEFKFHKDGKFESRQWTVQDGICGVLNNNDGPEYVAVMSDGFCSFSRKEKTETSIEDIGIPMHEVIEKALAFRGFEGVFVQRRLRKFEKDCKDCSWTHHDDLSLGVVNLAGGSHGNNDQGKEVKPKQG